MEKKYEYYPLTHAQRRIWYAEKKYRGINLWNVVFTHEFPRPIELDIVENAIQICIQNNDALRLRLIESQGEVNQYVCPYKMKPIEKVNFQNSFERDCYLYEKAKKKINPINSELFDFCIYKVDQGVGFFINIHHLICDAWTIRLLADQIWDAVQNLENGLPIGQPYPSYLDFQKKEQSYIGSAQFNTDRSYWLDQLREIVYPLKLGRTLITDGGIDSQRLNFYLSESNTLAIKNFCTNHQIQPFHFLFTVFAFCMSRMTNQKDLVIGTVVHNRTGRKEKNTAGMFVNTVPVRTCLDYRQSFIQTIRSMTYKTKTHLRHQRYPFDLLIQDLRETYGYSTDWLQV